MIVECKSEVEYDERVGRLRVCDVDSWIGGLPDGAVLDMIVRDFGNQRDPEPRLVGLRATWSETR